MNTYPATRAQKMDTLVRAAQAGLVSSSVFDEWMEAIKCDAPMHLTEHRDGSVSMTNSTGTSYAPVMSTAFPYQAHNWRIGMDEQAIDMHWTCPYCGCKNDRHMPACGQGEAWGCGGTDAKD